jgi:AcrR family transcriptional regulator
VNYHFGSKDNLLHTAALALLEEAVLESNRILMDESLSPQDQLKSFILDLTKVFYTHRNLTKVYLGAKFTEGSLQSATFIQPVLRRIFPDLPEDVIRVRAVQIAVPLQYVFIHEAAFEAYMGRPFDEAGVMAVVAQFVSNML